MGTGASGPEGTSTPTDGTAMAAWPVVGHGNATGADATWTLDAMVSVTAATGVGAARRTRATATAATTSTATTARAITTRRRVRRRRA